MPHTNLQQTNLHHCFIQISSSSTNSSFCLTLQAELSFLGNPVAVGIQTVMQKIVHVPLVLFLALLLP